VIEGTLQCDLLADRPVFSSRNRGVIAAHSTFTFYLLLAIRGCAISEPSIFSILYCRRWKAA
jgi:hypothetical protein